MCDRWAHIKERLYLILSTAGSRGKARGLFYRVFRKLGGHQVLIGYPLGQLARFLQNVLEQVEAVFLKDGVVLPGVLGFVSVHDHRDFVQGSFLELGLDGLGDLLGGVGVYVIHTFLDGIERRRLISADSVSEVLYIVMILAEE